ncbi:MAG: hypothetical protein ACOX5R_11710 [bacterium]
MQIVNSNLIDPNTPFKQLLFGIALLLCAVKIIYPVSDWKDILPNDESEYLRQGVMLEPLGIPSPQYAPLYSLLYYCFSRFTDSAVFLYDLHSGLFILILPLLLYGLLVRYRVNNMIAFLVAFFYLINHSSLLLTPTPSHFAAVLILGFALLASFVRSAVTYLLIVACAALLAAYSRPEFFLSFLLLLAAGGGVVIWQRKGNPGNGIAFVILACISAFLFYRIGLPFSGPRSWVAFSQHFTLNYADWKNITLTPWVETQEIITRQFGAADSFTEALFANPLMVLLHILYNLLMFPLKLAKALLYHVSLLFPDNSFFTLLEAIAAGLAGLSLLLIKKSRLKSAVREMPYFNREAFAFLAILFPPLVSTIIIYPREHYLFFISLGIYLLFARTVSHLYPMRHSLKCAAAVGLAVWAMTPGTTLATTFPKVHNPLLNRYAIAVVNQHLEPGKQNHVLDGVGLGIYFEGQKTIRYAVEKNEPFADFIKNHSFDVIFLAEYTDEFSMYRADASYQDFMVDSQRFGYETVRISGTEYTVYLRNKNLTDMVHKESLPQVQ